ncbi:Hypothetical protein CINCED_3A009622 [Cinara cedri]|uniref:Uncharacterized protein n=1 Tax=Cinara cedri TaxID=506608 RepID=A0A5E4MDC0_9HEMI|nr:Hypothetical protein CINCED_3A009622 [Cinara cedri]
MAVTVRRDQDNAEKCFRCSADRWQAAENSDRHAVSNEKQRGFGKSLQGAHHYWDPEKYEDKSDNECTEAKTNDWIKQDGEYLLLRRWALKACKSPEGEEVEEERRDVWAREFSGGALALRPEDFILSSVSFAGSTLSFGVPQSWSPV